MKKVVQRMCMGCNERKDKRELLRIVLNKEGIIQVDETGKLSGRGVYICSNTECLERVKKTKRLERALQTKINEKIYNDLRGVIIDKSEQNKHIL